MDDQWEMEFFDIYEKHIKVFIQDTMYFYKKSDNITVLLEYQKAQEIYRQEIENYSIKGSSRQTKSRTIGKNSLMNIKESNIDMNSGHFQSVNLKNSIRISQRELERVKEKQY